MSNPANSGYAQTCWPAEDGGPTREQAPTGIGRLLTDPQNGLELLAARSAKGAQMAVVGPNHSVYLLRSIFGHRTIEDPARAEVESIDPITLEPRSSSGILPAGPWWAGGLAVVANGDVIAVSGRWIHRLDPETLDVRAARQLPADRPYNSFVALADGTLAMKDIDRSMSRESTLLALDPYTLEDRAEPLPLGETVIARLSADGESVYAVGVNHAMRIRWNGSELKLDSDWRHRYRQASDQGYGWDPVVSVGRLWFLDQGRHRFRITMRGSGLDGGPVRLHSVPLDDASGATDVVVCGARHGAITNPPLVDPDRMIAIGYDSANGWLTAFDIPDDPRATPTERWRQRMHTAPHLMRFGDSGELIVHDHRAPWPWATRAGSWLLERGLADPLRRSGEQRPHLEPKLARAVAGEDLLVLDIATGAELSRASMPLMAQSVMFPTAGENSDVFVSSVTGIFRVGVR